MRPICIFLFHSILATRCPSLSFTLVKTGKRRFCYQQIGEFSAGEAHQRCKSMNGHAPAPLNGQENEDVKSLLLELGIEETWLGLSDGEQEGTWIDPLWRPINFTDWAEGQPNEGTIGNYATIKQFGWMDANGSRTYQTICFVPARGSSISTTTTSITLAEGWYVIKPTSTPSLASHYILSTVLAFLIAW